MTFLRTTFSALAVSLAALSPALACPDREAAVAAVNAGDYAAAAPLQAKIAVDAACDDAFRLWLDEGLARLAFLEAQKAPSGAGKQALFETSLNYFRHWRTHEALADLASETGDWTEEARQLQLAINQLNDGPAHHSASEAEIRDLVTRAQTAVALSDEVIETPRTRSGKLGGIFARNVRGFKVEEVPMPIEFEFDSTKMTSLGASYAQALLTTLLEEQPSEVLLEGHTDPVGTEAYNLTLSLDRASATKDYLTGGGYQGTVETMGLGETKRLPPPKNFAKDSPEHHQIERRVVLVW